MMRTTLAKLRAEDFGIDWEHIYVRNGAASFRHIPTGVILHIRKRRNDLFQVYLFKGITQYAIKLITVKGIIHAVKNIDLKQAFS